MTGMIVYVLMIGEDYDTVGVYSTPEAAMNAAGAVGEWHRHDDADDDLPYWDNDTDWDKYSFVQAFRVDEAGDAA